MNKFLQLVLVTLAAAVFCGLFMTVLGLALQWYYLSKLPDTSEVRSFLFSSYLLLSFLSSTLSVFVPLFLFNFIKMKYVQRRAKQ